MEKQLTFYNNTSTKKQAFVIGFLLVFLIMLLFFVYAYDQDHAMASKSIVKMQKQADQSLAFNNEEVSKQHLLRLLRLAYGSFEQDIIIPENKASEIEIYVTSPQGIFRYLPEKNILRKISGEKVQKIHPLMMASKPQLNLIYVVDISKVDVETEDDKILFAKADANFLSQNVFLGCTNEGLTAFIHKWLDKNSLGRLLGLRPEQRIVLAQSLSYPKR